MMKRFRPFWLIFFCCLFSSCAAYHPLPLDQKAEEMALKAPDLKALEVEASKIRHPLLRPVEFDLSDGISPDEAALLAVVANPKLRAVRVEKRIVSAQLLQAGLLPNPQISASYEIPTGGITSGTVNAYGLQLDWEITSLLTRGARISAAKAEKTAVDLAVAWQEWQVAEAAKLHLLRLLWSERKVAPLREAEKVGRKNLALVERAVFLGERTASDLADARAAYQQVKLELETAREELEQERLALNRILGLPPETNLKIQRDLPLSSWPPLLAKERLLVGLTERRLDLLALKMSYRAQDERLRAAVLSQFPKIGLGLLRAKDTGDVITTGVAISIDLPFFDRGQARIALEEATRQKLYDEYLARVFSARAEVVEILAKMAFLRRKMAISKKAIAALERSVAAYKKALDQGNASLLGYYRVQKELLAKRLEILGLRQTQSDLGVALEIASGTYFPMEVEKR